MADFEEPLLGCLADFCICLVAFCVPCGACCMQAQAVDRATQGNEGVFMPLLCVCCLGCIGAAINRGKIRESFSISGSFVNDCLIWSCCGPCAATQEYREVRTRTNK